VVAPLSTFGEPSVKRRKAVGISMVIAICYSNPFDAASLPAGKEKLVSQENVIPNPVRFLNGVRNLLFLSVCAKSRSLTANGAGSG
jgi:hypothetical protein